MIRLRITVEVEFDSQATANAFCKGKGFKLAAKFALGTSPAKTVYLGTTQACNRRDCQPPALTDNKRARPAAAAAAAAELELLDCFLLAEEVEVE